MSIFLRKNAIRLENKFAEQYLFFCEVMKMCAVFLHEVATTSSQMTLVRCRFSMRDTDSSMRGSQFQGLIHIRGP